MYPSPAPPVRHISRTLQHPIVTASAPPPHPRAPPPRPGSLPPLCLCAVGWGGQRSAERGMRLTEGLARRSRRARTHARMPRLSRRPRGSALLLTRGRQGQSTLHKPAARPPGLLRCSAQRVGHRPESRLGAQMRGRWTPARAGGVRAGSRWAGARCFVARPGGRHCAPARWLASAAVSHTRTCDGGRCVERARGPSAPAGSLFASPTAPWRWRHSSAC